LASKNSHLLNLATVKKFRTLYTFWQVCIAVFAVIKNRVSKCFNLQY